METKIPETANIEHPALWRLALQVDSEALRAIIWSTVEESSLVNFTLPLDPTLPPVKALEEAVYAVPALLSDFGRVDVVMRTERFLAAPTGLDSAAAGALLDYECITAGDSEPAVRTDSTPEADILWCLDAAVANFFARTFRNPRLTSHMGALLSYFSRKTLLGNSGKLYAHFHQGTSLRTTDIIAFGADRRAALITSKECRSDEDALYYILAAMKESGLDLRSDEILLCGHAGTRDVLMPMLRRYAASVMPVIFPSAAFRAGRQALAAPFPLVIQSLCE